MVPSLTDCYHRLGFQVTESEDGLRIGFKPGMAHAIVKEIWNEQPLTRSDVERFYEKLSSLNKGYRNLYFRIVAHGGFLPEALDFELLFVTLELPEQGNPICWHAISQIMQRKIYWSLLRTSRFWMRSGKPSDSPFRK